MSMLPGLLRFNSQTDDDAPDDDAPDEGVQPEPVPEATEPAPEPAPATRLATALPAGAAVTWRRQAWSALRLGWLTGWRRMQAISARPGGIFHWVANGQPESLAQERAYARKRAWVPPGHEGGIAETGGIAYHATIGPVLKLTGNGISWIASRPLRAGIAFLITCVLAAVLLYASGAHTAAWGLIVGLAVTGLLIWGALEAWTALARKTAEARNKPLANEDTASEED